MLLWKRRNLGQYWHHLVHAGYRLGAWRASMPPGGARVALTTLEAKGDFHRWPDFFPMENTFSTSPTARRAPTAASIWLRSISKERKLLLRNDSNAIYAAPGYLLFVREDTLMANALNLRSLALEGESQARGRSPLRSITDTGEHPERLRQTANCSISTARLAGGSQLIWYDASGKPGEPVLARNRRL